MGKRRRGRPRKRWVDVVRMLEEQNRKIESIQEWREVIEERKKWRIIVMAAKSLRLRE